MDFLNNNFTPEQAYDKLMEVVSKSPNNPKPSDALLWQQRVYSLLLEVIDKSQEKGYELGKKEVSSLLLGKQQIDFKFTHQKN